MCVSWAGRVVRVDDDGSAIVEVDGRRLRVATLICPEIKAGQWAVVATGLVLRRIGAREARRVAALARTAA